VESKIKVRQEKETLVLKSMIYFDDPKSCRRKKDYDFSF